MPLIFQGWKVRDVVRKLVRDQAASVIYLVNEGRGSLEWT